MSRLPVTKKRRLEPQNAAEAEYERRPRKLTKDTNDGRLPVRTAGEWVERSQSPSQPLPENAELEGITSDGEDIPGSAPEPEEPRKSQHEQILEAQEDLARIAGLVSEDPEEHAGLLKKLETNSGSSNPTVKKLALATQLAVYKDIIPGYRIRPASEQDMKAKLSKDVKKLRNFEQGLVVGYREYVKTLTRFVKVGSSREATEAQKSVASVAVSCVCTLLGAVPHFNFRSELLNIIVKKLSSRNVDADFLRCRTAIETLFADDEEGNASLEAVGLLTKMLKAKDYNIHPSVLNTFLHLRLLSEFIHKGSRERIEKSQQDQDDDAAAGAKLKQKRVFRTKKLRKQLRETKVVEKEMEEADAEVSHEDREKNQSETLKLVFVAYFRILKARIPNLMGAVLEGLARYAHLINQDFFGDILEALRDLVTSAVLSDEDEEVDETQQTQRDVSREALLCIVTAFALLQGQDVAKSASSLHLDLNFFITHLYKTLIPASLDCDIELKSKSLKQRKSDDTDTGAAASKINVQTTIVLLLRSLSSVVHPPNNVRSVTPLRLAAFAKQIANLSLQLPEKSCLAMIGLLRQVIKVNGGKIAALWYTEERKGDGTYDPLREEVEGSNPFAATVWEGELLRMHYCPTVREGWTGLEKQVQACRS